MLRAISPRQRTLFANDDAPSERGGGGGGASEEQSRRTQEQIVDEEVISTGDEEFSVAVRQHGWRSPQPHGNSADFSFQQFDVISFYSRYA